MSEENKKFRIGEFARVNGVTKHTLIHYDDIGLLTQAITEENGYRYYIDKQYSDFSNISQLKELGLSLKEIDEYIHQDHFPQREEILQNRMEAIEREIQRLTNLKDAIACYRKRVQEALATDPGAVTMEFRETEYGFFSRNLYENGESFSHSRAVFSRFCRDKNLFECRGWGTLIPIHYENGKWLSISSHIYVYADRAFHPDAVAVQPQGYYLVSYHQGDPRKLYQSFLRVMHYAESHHMTMGKFCFEEYVLGSFNTTQPQDYRIKILIPVL